MAVTFSDLHTEAGLKALDEFLSGKSYVSGDQITRDDIKVYAAVSGNPSGDLYPNANQWYETVSAKLAHSFPGKAVGVRVGGQTASAEATPVAEAKHCVKLSVLVRLCGVGTMAVGVLALQGSFNEHIAALKRLGANGVEIRKAEQLEYVSALIIPGGESTTMAILAEYHNLFPALRVFVKMGKPIWGTCAGLIFLADRAIGQKSGGQELIGGLNCTVHRNFFGSQLQSFESEILIPEIAAKEGGPPSFRGVFIRAPGILEVGPEVQVLADIPVPSDQTATSDSAVECLEENAAPEKKVIVAVKQGNLLATAFHPELTADTRWHSYFLKMVEETCNEASSSSISLSSEIPCLSEQPKYYLPIYQEQ